jgi:hypothetical protein
MAPRNFSPKRAIKDSIFGGQAAEVRFYDNGHVAAINGPSEQAVGTYTLGTYMAVTLVVDPISKTYGLFIPVSGIAVTGMAFNNPAVSSLGAVLFHDGNFGGAAGFDARIDNFSAVIPEPASAGLLAVGAAVLVWRRRKV